jgi:hypothetical protein
MLVPDLGALGVAAHLHLTVVEVRGARLVLVVLAAFAKRPVETGDPGGCELLDFEPGRRPVGPARPGSPAAAGGSANLELGALLEGRLVEHRLIADQDRPELTGLLEYDAPEPSLAIEGRLSGETPWHARVSSASTLALRVLRDVFGIDR